MEIKVKNTKGGEKTFTVPHTQNVLDLKLLIQVEFSIPANCQKLIFKGRILDDARTLSDYSMKAQDTIILTSTPSTPVSSTSAGVQTPPVQRVPPSSSSSSSQVIHRIPAPVGPSGVPGFQSGRSLGVMGGPSEVHGLSQGSRPAAENLSTEEFKSSPGSSVKRPGTFDFLMGNANFEQIVKIIREDPRAFEDFIMQLKAINPELHDLINKHKKEFIELIRGREAESDQVQLTKEEFNEVKELMSLGFSAQDCLEAYLGCGKNKELAASLLFSNNQ